MSLDVERLDLPNRVIVDQHGHYWRDYGTHLSMCPVSDENTETEVIAVFDRPESRAEAFERGYLAAQPVEASRELQAVVEASMNDIGLGTPERMDRARARLLDWAERQIALEQLDACGRPVAEDVQMAAVEECVACHDHLATIPPCVDALKDAERWAERFARYRP